jgi:hypothetical protein
MSSITDKLALLFSSTERRKGASAAEDRAVHLSSASDVFVNAVVRASAPGRVTLSASEIAGGDIAAKCTCAGAQKGQLCRHVWAALLKLEEQNHDFLLHKESISIAADDEAIDRSGGESQENFSMRRLEFQERQKALSKEYRKQRAQKRNENAETGRKVRTPAFHYPSSVEEARRYFQANGFEMKQPFELSEIVDAKKQLSRVFHPDKGGSHDEILELNRNFQILSDYLKS